MIDFSLLRKPPGALLAIRSPLGDGRKALKRGDDVFDLHNSAVFRILIEQIHRRASSR
jgi:hypothetical protein